MAICTLKAHVQRAVEFYNKESVYFCFGKYDKWTQADIGPSYSSSIDYDIYPPEPTMTSEMSQVIGYKKVEFKSLVVPDENGSLEYRGTKWKTVTPSNAQTEGARWVFLETSLAYNDFELTPAHNIYRKVGVYTGLVKTSGVSDATYALTPGQVSNPGLLEVIDFRKPVYRETDVREQVKIILEF